MILFDRYERLFIRFGTTTGRVLSLKIQLMKLKRKLCHQKGVKKTK